ncbi:MAG TPA: ester cyclase [Blastocatellia bacterium]|nr:ester cyclase [Blastocatellia bacterium]
MSESVTQDHLQTRERCLEEHIRAENRHDLDAIMSTFAADGVLVFNGRSLAGQETIRGLHEGLGFGEQGGFSDLRVEEMHRYASEEAITLEQVVTGRHTGEWQGIAATGRNIELAICTVYKFDEAGKLSRESVYFDTGGLLKQLGVL